MEHRWLPLFAAASIVGFAGGSRAGEPDRASTDAVCPWGRLADGHGALVRCLTEDEATRLREAPPTAPGHAALEPPKLMAIAPLDAPKPADPTRALAPDAAPNPPDAPKVASALFVELGPVVPDTGSLPDAKKNLNKARDRFLACTKSGGISPDGGDVELRFLVLGRGRAEGVSVQKRHGVSSAAAKCLADVVDRRYVGYPDGPEVGATLIVTMKKK